MLPAPLELRTEDFAVYRDLMLQTIKPTSLKRYLDPVHNLFEVARHEWGLPLRDNPLDRLKLKAPSQRRERRLLSGEWNRILAAAALCRNVWIEPIIRFALATGMRRGEILLIQQRHVDRERRTLLIPETKNGHSRTIPLSKETLALLHQFQDDGLRFPVSANAFRLAWERVRQRAGMKDFHFHDLRHEAISRFFELGLTAPEVALISGHRDFRMLFRYAHGSRVNILTRLDHDPKILR